jgi:hypothetical protein
MDNFLNAMFSSDGVTANGAITHTWSNSACLDFFFIAGASRNMSEESIIQMWNFAYAENPDLACKILFWSRDTRGGAGQRYAFQIIMRYIHKTEPQLGSHLAIHTPEYGYWKDIFVTESPNEDNINWLHHQLIENPNRNLLAKWFPRKGAWFVAMHKFLDVTPGTFRRILVSMSNTVEQHMCAQEWTEIEYSKLPSIAGFRYRNAFARRDTERYTQFIKDVAQGKEKVNSGVLYPHQLVAPIINGGYCGMSDSDVQDITNRWNALPNFMEGCTERILPMCDVSGSMSGLPMEVSIGLGMYISERNQGAFKDVVLTFSDDPEFHHITGNDLKERVYCLQNAGWGMSTNLQEAFRIILQRAINSKVPVELMPTKLLIISDMEFNEAGSITNYDAISKQYADAGYPMPGIIFWNVNGRQGNVPVKCDTPNTGLVSGFSPSILTSILKGSVLTPEEIMLNTVMTPRYKAIDASYE